MKKKYFICNISEDEVIAEFEFEQEEVEFLKKVFAELNTHSKYHCTPKIYIKEIVMCCDCTHKEEVWFCEDELERGYCQNCERREEE